MEKPKVVLIVCKEHQMIRKFGKWKRYTADDSETLKRMAYTYDVHFDEMKCPLCPKSNKDGCLVEKYVEKKPK